MKLYAVLRIFLNWGSALCELSWRKHIFVVEGKKHVGAIHRWLLLETRLSSRSLQCGKRFSAEVLKSVQLPVKPCSETTPQLRSPQLCLHRRLGWEIREFEEFVCTY